MFCLQVVQHTVAVYPNLDFLCEADRLISRKLVNC